MQPSSGKPKGARSTVRVPVATDRDDVISSIAYSLYEARGSVDGHALEDWLEAEARVSQAVPAAKRQHARAAAAG
jgi:hypothetical protein